MKILLCFGTRPEAIKMAPVYFELLKEKVDLRICVTAQHREMLDQVLIFFGIKADYDLNLMKPGQSLNQLSSAIIGAIDEVLEKEKPDIVLVHGDTTTSCMAALAAFHQKIKVGHIEAGLRTYNKESPYPEEVNRQITGRIADFHFAPTESARLNLVKEGTPDDQIFVTGNTIVDALEWARKKIDSLPLEQDIERVMAKLDPSKKLILVTGHRRENFGRGMEELCKALSHLASQNGLEIIFPVHANPKVKEPVHRLLSGNSSIQLIEPVSYPSFLHLIQRCDLIISDSGGVQEEAPSFSKPVVVTRKISERVEGVEAGYFTLAGTDKKKIIDGTLQMIANPPKFDKMSNPFGDGRAAERIVKALGILE